MRAASRVVVLAAVLLISGCASGVEPDSDTQKDPESSARESTAAVTPEPDGYKIVDTGQSVFYDAVGVEIEPVASDPFALQDAHHDGHQPSYSDNGDGTVTDNVTDLMWSQTPDLNGDATIDINDKRSYREALASAAGLKLAGYQDWRVPSIKELYSLIDFSGVDPSGIDPSSIEDFDVSELAPFINTDHFGFGYGDIAADERIIDAQYATSTRYVSTTMGRSDTMFGVNFADGRIKGYPTGPMPGESQDKGYYVLYVRGNPAYGLNSFADNGDGTITDASTGLMWAQDDSGTGLNWVDAMTWTEQMNSESYLGYTDWRLPNIKELQSIVDYTKAPAVTNSAAINPLFTVTQITNEAGAPDAGHFWSSTTHTSASRYPGADAAYVAFGRAMGYANGTWLDAHGAGAQRSDPKRGSQADWPRGRGPQGDAIRIRNYVRLVRDF